MPSDSEIARSHGAGRFTIDDSITPEIGFEILPNRGDYISEGEVWLAFHHNEDIDDDTMLKLVQSIHLSDEPIKQTGRLIGKIDWLKISELLIKEMLFANDADLA